MDTQSRYTKCTQIPQLWRYIDIHKNGYPISLHQMHSNSSALRIHRYPFNWVSYLSIHLDTRVVDIMTSLIGVRKNGNNAKKEVSLVEDESFCKPWQAEYLRLRVIVISMLLVSLLRSKYWLRSTDFFFLVQIVSAYPSTIVISYFQWQRFGWVL